MNLVPANSVEPLKKSTKCECLLNGRARDQRHFCPAAAISLLNSCPDSFKIEEGLCGIDAESKSSFRAAGSLIIRLQNAEREVTVSLKVISDGRNYIALTAHAFKYNVCDWIGVVIEWYIFCVSITYGRFTTVIAELFHEKIAKAPKR